MGSGRSRLCFSESKKSPLGGQTPVTGNKDEYPALGLEGAFFVREGELDEVLYLLQRNFIHCIAKSSGVKERNVFVQDPQISKDVKVYEQHDEVIIKAVVMAPSSFKHSVFRAALLQNVATKLDGILRDNEFLFPFKPSYRNLCLGPDSEAQPLRRLSQLMVRNHPEIKQTKQIDKDKEAKQNQSKDSKGHRESLDRGSIITRAPDVEETPTVTSLGMSAAKGSSKMSHLRGNPKWLYLGRWSSEDLGPRLLLDDSEREVWSGISHYQNAYTLDHARGHIWLWEINLEEVLVYDVGVSHRPFGLGRRKKVEAESILIGVTDGKAVANSLPFTRGAKGVTAIAYRSDGKLERSDLDNPIEFGDPYKIDDRITIRLRQLAQGTSVEFFKNLRRQGKRLVDRNSAYLKLNPEHKPLRCAVALPGKGVRFRLGEALNMQEMGEIFKTGVQTTQWGMVICKQLEEKLLKISRYKNILSKEYLVKTLQKLARSNHSLYRMLSSKERALLSTLLTDNFPEPRLNEGIFGLGVHEDEEGNLQASTVTVEMLVESEQFQSLPNIMQENLIALADHFRGKLPPVSELATIHWDQELAKIVYFQSKSKAERADFQAAMEDILSKHKATEIDVKAQEARKKKKKQAEENAKMGMDDEKAQIRFAAQMRRQHKVGLAAKESAEKMLDILLERGLIESLKPAKIKQDGTGRHFDFCVWIDNLEEIDGFYLKEAFLRLRDGISMSPNDVTLADLLTVLARNYPKKLNKLMENDTEDYVFRSPIVMKEVRACMRKAGEALALCKPLQDLDRQQAEKDGRGEEWYAAAARIRLSQEQEELWKGLMRPMVEQHQIEKTIKEPFLNMPEELVEEIQQDEDEEEEEEPEMTEDQRRRKILEEFVSEQKEGKSENYFISIAQRLRTNGNVRTCRLELDGQVIKCTDLSKIEKARANKTKPKPLVEIDLWFAKTDFEDKNCKWEKYPEFDRQSIQFEIDGSTLNIAFETQEDYKAWCERLVKLKESLTGPATIAGQLLMKRQQKAFAATAEGEELEPDLADGQTSQKLTSS